MGREKLRGEEAWEVEAILDERKSSRWNCTEFLIKWKGYSSKDNSWEPEHGIDGDDLIEQFRARKKRQLASQKKKKEETKTSTPKPTAKTPRTPKSTTTTATVPKPSPSTPAAADDSEATDDDDDKVIIVRKKKKSNQETAKPTTDEKKKRKQPDQSVEDKSELLKKKKEQLELLKKAQLENLQRLAKEAITTTSSTTTTPSSSNPSATPTKSSATPKTSTTAATKSATTPKPATTSTTKSTSTTTAAKTTSKDTAKDKDSSKKKKKNKQYSPEELARKEAKREKKRRKLAKREAEEARLKAAKENPVKTEKKDEVKPKPPKVELPKPIKKLPPTNLCSVCRDQDENPVIACFRCGVEVHPGCYGVQTISIDWKCALCEYLVTHPRIAYESCRCCLCPSPVGALKPSADGRWVHSACAIWIPETSFGNNETLEPVLGLDEIPRERWALVCCICNKSGSCCIQCDYDQCCESFHVTCAQEAGYRVEFVQNPDDLSSSMTALAYCREHGIRKTQEEETESEEDDDEDDDDERDENAKLIDQIKDASTVDSRLDVFDALSYYSSEALAGFCKAFVEADGLAVFATWMDEGLKDISASKRGEPVGVSLETLIILQRNILKTLKKLWEVEKYESALLRQQRLLSQTSQLGRSDQAPDGELAGLAHSLYYRWTGERLEVTPYTHYVLPRSSRDYDDFSRTHNIDRVPYHREKRAPSRWSKKDVHKMDGTYHRSNRDNDSYRGRPPPSRNNNYYNSNNANSNNSFSTPTGDISRGYSSYNNNTNINNNSNHTSDAYHTANGNHDDLFPNGYPPATPASSSHIPISSNPYYNNYSAPPLLSPPSFYPPSSSAFADPHPRTLPTPPIPIAGPSHAPAPAVVVIEPKVESRSGVKFEPPPTPLIDDPNKPSAWPPKRSEPMPSCLKAATPRPVSVQWANEDALCEWIEFTATGALHGLKIKKKDKKVRTKKVLRVGTPTGTD